MACIQSILEADYWKGLGVIFTAVLTALIIWQSFRISKQQKKMQKDLQKESEDLQKKLAGNNIAFQERLFDDNAKIALYKHRADCYLTIIEAADLFFELDVKVPIVLLQERNAQIEILNELSRLKSLIFKTSHEARILFSKEVHECYLKHRDLSIRLYDLWFMLTVDTNTMKKFGEELQSKLIDIPEVHQLDITQLDIVKLMELFNSNNEIKAIMNSYPIIKDCLDVSKELYELFHSDKIDKLVESYIDVKNLGNRERNV